MNTKDRGNIVEAEFTLAFLRAGFGVLQPVGDNLRYDMVVDTKDGRLLRMQCKSGKYKNGKIAFAVSSSNAHRGGGRRDYKGEVDFFCVSCEDLEGLWVVPINAVGRTICTLRVLPPLNNNQVNILWAEAFVFTPESVETSTLFR